jgi:phospholipid/cholesterol/gamma-HCH transport system permease protein
MATETSTAPACGLGREPDGSLVVRLSGDWALEDGLRSVALVERAVDEGAPTSIRFDASDLGRWDSSILAFLVAVSGLGRQRGIAVDRSGLPDGLGRLLALAEAVPARAGARAHATDEIFIDQIGESAIRTQRAFSEGLAFVGEVTMALVNTLRGRARFRRHDLVVLIQQSGLEALPIVTLVTFLLGLILAFVGAVQLQTFGATIYVADLVGVAMVRDMGALITGIIMAGRSGAAFAAQLGSMRVTQETDALTTMALSPLEFLVVPRVLALSLMMPLLTLYGDAMGILGGAFVGWTMLDLSGVQYFQQTTSAVSVGDLWGGLLKGTVYGVLVAVSGCLRGMQSGKSSSAVGDAATSAVVTSIVAIIVACGMFAFLFYTLGL